MKLIALIDKDFDVLLAFLFPTALAPMLVKLLTNERFAIMTTIITAATAGVMLQEGLLLSFRWKWHCTYYLEALTAFIYWEMAEGVQYFTDKCRGSCF